MGKTFEEHVKYNDVLNKLGKMLNSALTDGPDNKTGYVLLVFRDIDAGNTDMITNLETEFAKMALEDILKTIDKKP